MSGHRYEPVPGEEDVSYPPSSSSSLEALAHTGNPPFPLRRPHRNLYAALKYAIGVSAALLVLHHASTNAFPSSGYAQTFRPTIEAPSQSPEPVIYTNNSAHDSLLAHLDLERAGKPGTFFRDPYPIRTMLAFWDLAEQEIEERGLDTCDGKLGRPFINAYHQTHLDYCLPEDQTTFAVSNFQGNGNSTYTNVRCAAVHRSYFTSWWPYPAAPCVSSNLRTSVGDLPFARYGCDLTRDGKHLKSEMRQEKFLGTQLVETAEGDCKSTIDHTVVIIPRQDQWNPFHADEDFVTTLVSIFVGIRAAPVLVDTPVQLVFNDQYMLEGNHFSALWDRIGAWPPRRLSLDPWEEGSCLTNAIHSIGAGASLLSAQGVGSSHSCVSSITWAASHYYRHLFGFLPSLEKASRPPIHILWLSRAKFDAYAHEHDLWSMWRGARHFDNEAELLDRFRSGLAEFCDAKDCHFDFGEDAITNWGNEGTSSGRTPVRFSSMDPTVHTFENQIARIGHTTLLIGAHGGALGLSLFLPPGEGTILELQTRGTAGNFHFHNLAMQLGHDYSKQKVESWLDVDAVWTTVEGQINHIWT